VSMAAEAGGPEEMAWHRRFAVDAFNRTWELIDQEGRSAEDERQMLAAAFTSRYHWGEVGGPEQWWMGDWQIAHVASLLGEAGLALSYATMALERVQDEGWTGWRLASAYEGMARACASAGDGEGRDRFVDLAGEALEGEADPEEREVMARQLASVPQVG
jgi:hypothetical protein